MYLTAMTGMFSAFLRQGSLAALSFYAWLKIGNMESRNENYTKNL